MQATPAPGSRSRPATKARRHPTGQSPKGTRARLFLAPPGAWERRAHRPREGVGTQFLPRPPGVAPGVQRPEAHHPADPHSAGRPRGPPGGRRRPLGVRGHLRRAVRPLVYPARPDPPAGVRAAVHHCRQGHRDHHQARHRVCPGRVEAPVPEVPQVRASAVRASAVRPLPARGPGAASGAVRRRVLDHRRAHHRFPRPGRAASRPDPDHSEEVRRLDDPRFHHHRGTYWPA